MSAIVCNAGPLIALAGIGQVKLLRGLFEQVLVPPEVRAEVVAGGPGGVGADLFRAAWLEVTPLLKTVDPLLVSLLDSGEAATIALAVEHSASMVLMDEVKERRVARNVYGLAVIGTGRLLVEAKRAALIPQVRPLLEQMRNNGYWISESIVAEILRTAGESGHA